ncbi:hypothetical protein BC831DRAFT_443768 [Entophlyctis helioformis]|nr:hypothetical protein BC831DRAFT_443768 [Entophlyctis helioformis]
MAAVLVADTSAVVTATRRLAAMCWHAVMQPSCETRGGPASVCPTVPPLVILVLLALQPLSLHLCLRLFNGWLEWILACSTERLVLAACTPPSHVHDGRLAVDAFDCLASVAIRRMVVDQLLLVTARWRWAMGCWAILPSAILCGTARCLAIVLCTVDATNSLGRSSKISCTTLACP